MGQLATLFGKQVKAIRRARGLSQAELAELVSLSEEWIRRIERGEGSPSLDTVDAISDALQEDVSVLFGAEVAATALPVPLLRDLSEMNQAELDWVAAAVALIRNRP